MTRQKNMAVCPAGVVSVGGKLKLQVLYHLLDGTKRFGELQRLIAGASRQMLTIQLRELEQAGFLHRQVYEQVPPKVEYSLTELGRSFEPMMRQMFTWGEQYCNLLGIEPPWMSNVETEKLMQMQKTQ